MASKSCGAALVVIGGLIFATQVYADLPSAAISSDSGNSGDLQEIVVTAQRRSESLERTPVAITVLGSDDLAKRDIVSEADLQLAVPGVTVRAGLLGSNQLNYSIRGQTIDAFSSSQPAVLPYVNEVAITGPGGASAFYDLQSVQVLKGPQGTLFGKNTTGGAVLFTTAKPTDTFGGYFSASTGNYGLAQFEGALSGPIIDDKVLGRIAAFYESRNGIQYNTFTNTDVGAVLRDGVRGSLTFKFSESVKDDLVVDYYHAGGTSTNLVLYNVAPQFSNNAAIPANLLYTPFLDTALGFPGAFAAYSAGNPKIPPGGLYAFLALQKARGPYIVSDNNPSDHLANNLEVSNITTADLTENVQFKNVFGFNSLRSSDGDDADGTPYLVDGTPTGVPYGIFRSVRAITEEPQILGKAFDGELSYVSGLYFSDQREVDRQLSYFVDLEPLAPGASQHNDTTNRDRSYAGYGQGTYDLGRITGVTGLGVTAGVRYTSETVSSEQLPTSSYFNAPPPLQDYLQQKFNKVSWQFGLQEQLNPNTLLYLVSRRSFRSGGFNTIAPPTPGFGSEGGDAFNAETATDVEVGTKFQGTLGSMPTRLNVAAYSERVDKIQRVVYTVIEGSPAGVTTNVPQAKVSGAEVDAQINPVNWLSFGTSFTYTDAKFTSNEVTIPGTPPVTVGFGPYADTPEWSGSVFSEARAPISSDLQLSLRAEVYDQTHTYFTSTANTLTPGAELPEYAVVNFRVSLDDPKAGWSVTANLKNAFNRVYYVGGLGSYNVFTTNAVVPGDPRTFVVTARYNF